MSAPPSQLLTTDQAAEYLSISRGQLYRLRNAGRITPIRLGDQKALRWHLEDLDRFVDELRAAAREAS